ncbi:MAG: hypothetical protein GC186_16500 [Rhodobacteraceae bacterium]|nr:hypothetical protein [Paracoccaceae bacterium]
MTLPPLSLQLSSGPAISGGNPTTGPASDGTFAPVFGGAQGVTQSLISMLPVLGALAVGAWVVLHHGRH